MMTYAERAELLNALKVLDGGCKKEDCDDCSIRFNLGFCLMHGKEEDFESRVKSEQRILAKRCARVLSECDDDYVLIKKQEVEEMREQIERVGEVVKKS